LNVDRFLDNRTPMVVVPMPMDDRHGREVLVVIAKLTWDVSEAGVASLAVPQPEVRISEARAVEGLWSSLRYPSDLIDEKPGTDVVLVGTAHPPLDRQVTEMDVHLRVDASPRALEKTVRVFGQRIYYKAMLGVAPGPPAVLGKTPLLYELAFGGRDESDPAKIVLDPRNPSGVGFATDKARLIGTRAPQLEVPDGKSAPAGFGPIPAHWSPRSERAGTYDATWQKKRAPLRPTDFDPRHNSVAHPDLWSETPLVGDELVEVVGATPEGLWRFRLPRYAPVFESVIREPDTGDPDRAPKRVETQHPTHLDTFVIDADARTVELTWRASIPLPRKSEHVETILVLASNELAPEVWSAAFTKLAEWKSRETHKETGA
jgi:hypothetical protein